MNDAPYNFSEQEIEKFRIDSNHRKTYETGLTREDRYLLNVINMKILEKIEKEMEKGKSK